MGSGLSTSQEWLLVQGPRFNASDVLATLHGSVGCRSYSSSKHQQLKNRGELSRHGFNFFKPDEEHRTSVPMNMVAVLAFIAFGRPVP